MSAPETILLSHGAGGRMTHRLIEDLFVKHLKNPELSKLDDAAELRALPGRPAMTTDAFVVNPLFFPGGDIGKLAVFGTVNDLAMKGAVPVALSAAFIIEEGTASALVERVVRSMAEAARSVPVDIVCGDTKVVEKGAADALFIVTAGIGTIADGLQISASAAKAGDAVILSGTLGDHGVAVLQARDHFGLEGAAQSDCAALNGMVGELLAACPEVHVLRDPTRGGLATTLNEIANASGVRIEIREDCIPVSPRVRAACDMLGLDPLYIANEGKCVAFLPESMAETALKTLRKHPLGRSAARIGKVVADRNGRVDLLTPIGGKRPLRMLEGDQLPRIC